MRIACGVVVLAVLVAPLAGQPATKAPTKEDVARWIEQLGSDDFDTRELATRKLWEAGALAEAAVEKATKSGDVEVARRARDVAEKFRWGVYPDTPKAVVDAIGRFQTGDLDAKRAVVGELLGAGTAGCKALVRITKQDLGADLKPEILSQVSSQLGKSIPDLLATKNLAVLQDLLEIALADPTNVVSRQNYVAYWLLAGKLDERIAHHKDQLGKGRTERQDADLLALLYRAKGDYKNAAAVAEKAGQDELLDNLLYESADWKALAARGDKVHQGDEIESLGHRASYACLAGDHKTFDALVLELKQRGEMAAAEDDRRFQVAKALFLNGKADLGMALLEKGPYLRDRVEILIGRMRHKEAFALIQKARDDKADGLPALELLEARTLHGLGEKDKARKILDRYAEQIKAENDLSWLEDLIDAEVKCHLREKALEDSAKILAVSNDMGWPGRLFPKLFPGKGRIAEPLWVYVGLRFKGQEKRHQLRQLRDLLDGKTVGEPLKEIAKGASATLDDVDAAERDRALVALAEVLHRAGESRAATDLLVPVETYPSLLLQGDIAAGKDQPADAAKAYQAAFEKAREKPLALFLAGAALEKAGKAEEGRAKIDQSHWLSLGNEEGRDEFLRELARRGHAKALAREVDLLRRTAQPGDYHAGEAMRRMALTALDRKDYAAAASGHEQAMLRCLRSYINFVEKSAYVGVPAMVHTQRAAGLAQAGKFDEAAREFAVGNGLAPGVVEGTIRMCQVLDKAGRKAESDALFDKAIAEHRALLKDHPDCAWALNSTAWLAANVKKGLAQAKKDAERAVALEPDAPGYLDTLAEVLFQLGEKDAAVAAQKKVVALAPHRAYFKKQLARLEAGDPKADLPPEDDDEED